MAKRSTSRSQAEDAGQTAQPKSARPRRARTNAPASEAPDTFTARAPEELPNIPEPGDAADVTQQTESSAAAAMRAHGGAPDRQSRSATASQPQSVSESDSRRQSKSDSDSASTAESRSKSASE